MESKPVGALSLRYFVDIRIRRTVRAEGFKGSNFEKLLGPSRHRWMKGLGNKFILTRTGPIDPDRCSVCGE